MDFWHDYEVSVDPVRALAEKAYLAVSEKDRFESEASSADHSRILDLEHDLLPVLARMELHGVALDADKLRHLGEKMLSEIHSLETLIHDTVGEKFNINSSKQLQEILF